MHLRIGSGGQDSDGRNQDRSKSAHLPHLEVYASRNYTFVETSAAFYARFGSNPGKVAARQTGLLFHR